MRYKRNIYNYILTIFFVLSFGFLIVGIYQKKSEKSEQKQKLDNKLGKHTTIEECSYSFYYIERDMTIEELSAEVKQDKNVLRYNNPFLICKIKISRGQRILVYDKNIIIYKMKEKEKIENVLKYFNITKENIKKRGSGKYGINYLIIENPNITDEKLESQQREKLDNFYLNLRELKYTQREIKKNYDVVERSDTASNELYWPVNSFRITSYYGKRDHPILKIVRFHNGIDIAAPIGTSVFSSIDGEVTYSGYKGGYGKFIEIKNQDGMITDYGHLSRIIVKKGDRIKKGDLIGMVGNTGFSTGPHLHFEVKENNISKNPLKYRYDKNIGA